MASTALRQIFLEAAITLAKRGDLRTANDFLHVVKASDREEVERRGRKRGERVADRFGHADPTCTHCNDIGAIRDNGDDRDCPHCSG